VGDIKRIASGKVSDKNENRIEEIQILPHAQIINPDCKINQDISMFNHLPSTLNTSCIQSKQPV